MVLIFWGKIYFEAQKTWMINRPYAYDVIISLRPPVGDYRITRESSCQRCARLPAADHKRVQGNGFVHQLGSTMMSMHKVYSGNGPLCITH